MQSVFDLSDEKFEYENSDAAEDRNRKETGLEPCSDYAEDEGCAADPR